jgi:hypothetical protein
LKQKSSNKNNREYKNEIKKLNLYIYKFKY